MIFSALELRFKPVGASVGKSCLVLLAAARRYDDSVVLGLQIDRFKVAAVELGNELAVGRRLHLLATADQALREEREHDHDQDWEGCALEKTAHYEVYVTSEAVGLRRWDRSFRVTANRRRANGPH